MPPYRPRHLTPPPAVPDPSRRRMLRGGVASAVAASVGAAALGTSAHAAGDLLGQDVSNWQGEVDWAGQWAAGSRFAYVKATEGQSYRSPSFNHQYIGASNVGMARGGYHFARPDSGAPGPQVDFFLNNGGGWTDDGITLPGMVDFESYSGLPANYGLTQQELREWINGFLIGYRDQVGRRPVVYTNANWWNDNVGAWTPTNTPLFIAAYRSTAPTTLPANWWAWEMWQYSDSGPFAGDSIRWHGSQADFEDFLTNSDYKAVGI